MKSFFAVALIVSLLLFDGTFAWPDQATHLIAADGWSASRPDGHAPIGVMGEHTHHQGEWMFSYRWKYMDMDGWRDGMNKISDGDVLRDFMVAPTKMSMEMHMFGVMTALTDDLTLMGMFPYVLKSMDHRNRAGVTFKTHAEGLGDIKLSGLYKIYDDHYQRIHLNIGASFPSGDIDQRDDTPTGNNAKLSYPMQLVLCYINSCG